MNPTTVSCNRCGDVIEVPTKVGENSCKCGLTYVRRHRDGIGWGGPGTPIPKESHAPASDPTTV